MASVTDKITDVRNAARPNPTTVSNSRSAAGTTLSCTNLAGWPTASKVHFVTYRVDSNSNPVAGTQLDCSGVVSGNDISSLTVIDGTDAGNSVGDIVEMLPTAAWGQDLADALGVTHERTGANKSAVTYPSPVFSGTATGTYTLAGTPTLTSPTINTPTIASPTISGTVTGAVVKNANLSTSAGEPGAAWADWTPTFANFTKGSASIVAKYQQIGKTVNFRLNITLASSTMGTSPTFTLPVTAAAAETRMPVAHGQITDANGNTSAAYAQMATTTTAQMRYWNAAANGDSIAVSTPFTWADTDQLSYNGTYEAA